VEAFEIVELTLGIGAPAALVLAFSRADWLARKSVAKKAEAAKANVAVREPTDLSAGAALFRVHVVARDGARVSLGASIENPNELSGEPTLTTEAFEVETASGVRLAVPRGAQLKVNALAGAHRKLVDSVTTESGGVQQRFSFEVAETDTFVLSCVVAEPPGDGPFRESVPTLGCDKEFAINPKPVLPEHTGVGCLVYPALVISAVLPIIGADETFAKVVGWIVWFVLVGVGLIGWLMAKDSIEEPVANP
jgi:hypothetical protein